MNRLPDPTEQAPDVFNGAYITNSRHYNGDHASRGGVGRVADVRARPRSATTSSSRSCTR
jgi:hypothetical protein